MKKLILCFFAICVSLGLYSQDFLSLNGLVEDSRTGDPMALVSVNLHGTDISIISNADGFFNLKVPCGTDPESHVLVSYLGYLTADFTVNDFLSLKPGEALEIKMIPTSLHINPAVVRSIEPEILFASAFANVRKNYHADPIGMTAFYREMVRKGSNRYLVLNEAVVDIEKAGYRGYNSDKAAIYKGRGSVNYQKSDSMTVKFQGGLYSALELDIVKDPFIGTTIQYATAVYDFSLGQIVSIEGKPFYALNFQPKPQADPLLFKGTLYIDTESLAFGRMEFEMVLEGHEEEAAGIFVVKHPAKTIFGITNAKYILNFRESDGVWYFDYTRADVSFYTRKRGSMFKTNYSVTGELAVTDHKKGEFHIKAEDRVKFKDILSEQVEAFEDPDFWESYNVIEPDQSIDKAIKRIIRQLKRRGD